MKSTIGLILLLLTSCGDVKTSATTTVGAEIEKAANDIMETHQVAGLSISVVKGQEVILSEGFGFKRTAEKEAYTGHTANGVYSATKTFSMLAILSLVEDDLIDIDAQLGSYLDGIPTDWEEIPFWRLLNHTSGITMIINKPEFGEMGANPGASDKDVFEVVKKYPLDYEPGQYSRYQQSGFAIAAMIVSNQLGMSWPEIVKERVTDRSNSKSTFYSEIASGERIAPLLASAGGYETTAEDMSNFFKALNAEEIVSLETLKRTLYAEEYVVDNYSLGSIIDTHGDAKTLGHRGGGARANIRYAPDQQIGVAIFTDQQDNHEITVKLADRILRRLLLDQPFEKSKRPIQIPLNSRTDSSGASIVAFFKEAKTTSEDDYDFAGSEQVLNRLGYMFLRENRLNDAIEIFQLNTEEHPLSGNTFDSLGEAYLARGDREEAISSYEMALQLNPKNQNASDVLNRIRP